MGVTVLRVCVAIMDNKLSWSQDIGERWMKMKEVGFRM
jgi:hypothetical protein